MSKNNRNPASQQLLSNSPLGYPTPSPPMSSIPQSTTYQAAQPHSSHASPPPESSSNQYGHFNNNPNIPPQGFYNPANNQFPPPPPPPPPTGHEQSYQSPYPSAPHPGELPPHASYGGDGNQNQYAPIPPMNQIPGAVGAAHSAPSSGHYSHQHSQLPGSSVNHNSMSQPQHQSYPHSGPPMNQNSYGYNQTPPPPPPPHGPPPPPPPYDVHSNPNNAQGGYGHDASSGKKQSLQEKLMQKVNDPKVHAMAGKLLSGKKHGGSSATGGSAPAGYPSGPPGYPSGPGAAQNSYATGPHGQVPGYPGGESSAYPPTSSSGSSGNPNKQSMQQKLMEKLNDPAVQNVAGKVLKTPMGKKIAGKLAKSALGGGGF